MDVELRLESALWATVRLLSKAGGEAPKGLDRGGYWVLAKLNTLAPIRLSDLAVALELDPSTVSRHIKTLFEAGLVQRESDPADRRAALLSPTSEGRSALEASRVLRLRSLREATASWSETDRELLVDLLERLAESEARVTAARLAGVS